MFLNQFFLRFQYIPQQLNIIFQCCILSHDRSIRFSTHADGDYIFKLSASFQSIFPEFCNSLSVCSEIPGISVNRILTSEIFVFFPLP